MSKINFKDVNFLLNTLMFTGIPGFVFLGISQGIETFEQVTMNIAYSFLSIEFTCLFAYLYLFLLMIKKKDINIKQAIYILLIIPLLFWSYIGHLGTSDALSFCFGVEMGGLYTIIILFVYIFVIIKKLKTMEKK